MSWVLLCAECSWSSITEDQNELPDLADRHADLCEPEDLPPWPRAL